MAEKLSESDSRNAVTGFLPARQEERCWGFGGLTFTMIAFGIASWTFLTGGYVGSVINAKQGIGAILFGNAGGLFLLLPVILITARYGIDQFVASRATLGYRGNDIFTVLVCIINTLWTTVTSFMVGSSVAYIISVVNPDSWFATRTGGAGLFTMIAWTVSLWLAYKGPNYLEKFSKVSVVSMFAITAGLMVYVLSSSKGLFSVEPASPYADPNRGIATSVEWAFGSAIG